MGDTILLAVSLATGTAQTFTVPSGFTLATTVVNSGSNQLALYTKSAVAADASSSISVSWQTSAPVNLHARVYSGVHPTQPVLASWAATTTASTTVAYGSWNPPVTTTSVVFAAASGAVDPGVIPGSFGAQSFLISPATSYAAYMRSSEQTNWVPWGQQVNPTSTAGASSNFSTLIISLRPALAAIARSTYATVPPDQGYYGGLDQGYYGNAGTASSSIAIAFNGVNHYAVRVGDLILVSLLWGGSVTCTPPTGYTLVPGSSSYDAGTSLSAAMYYKFATSSDAYSTGTITFTFSGAVTIQAVADVMTYAGVDQTNPFDVVVGPTFYAAGVNSGTAAIAAMTTTTPFTLGVVSALFMSSRAASVTYKPSGLREDGYTQLGQYYYGASFRFSQPLPVAGNVGSVSLPWSDSSNGSNGVCFSALALRRANPLPDLKGISSGGNNNSATTSVTALMPAGISAGDMLVAFVTANSDIRSTLSGLSGWTQAYSMLDNGAGSATLMVYTKRATGSEGSSLTITNSTSTYFYLTILDIDSSAGIDSFVDHYDANTSLYYPAFTPTKNASLVIYWIVTMGSSGLGSASSVPGIPQTEVNSGAIAHPYFGLDLISGTSTTAVTPPLVAVTGSPGDGGVFLFSFSGGNPIVMII